VAACGRAIRVWTPHPQKASWVDLSGHRGDVNGVTFTPDGMYIASAADDGTIRIWSAGSGHSVVHPLPTHEQAVNSVTMSQDGAFIVSGSNDRSARVWNASTGEAVFPPLCGHANAILSVTTSPDRRLIASASVDCTIRLWDAQSGEAVGGPMRDHTNYVRSVTFSHDGHWLASVSDDYTVHMWDVATQRVLTVHSLPNRNRANVVAIFPDDGIVAVGDWNGHIYLWQAEADTNKHERELLHRADMAVWSIAFSPDSTRIVSGGNDSAARIWSINAGRCIHALLGHTDSIWSVAWSRDGRLIGTSSHDTTVCLWDAMTGSPLTTLRGHTKAVMSVAFTRNQQFIVSGSADCTIRKWDIRAACKPASVRHNDAVAALGKATLQDGWLVGSSGELILWVPAEYRAYLAVFPCTLRIDQRRVNIGIGESYLYAGLNWSSCWLN